MISIVLSMENKCRKTKLWNNLFSPGGTNRSQLMNLGRLVNSVKELNRKDTWKSGALQSFKAFMEGELHDLTVNL